MSGHTPGPWRVSMSAPYYHFQVSSEAGTRICMTTDAVNHDAGPDERQANARLIAAAPELLEALQRLLPLLVQHAGVKSGSAFAQALTALAKATQP